MAITYPKSIRHRRSPAEVQIFGLLKRCLSDEFVVVHHVQWLQREPTKRARDGEADFVVAHPDFGALILEVKGGEVRFDAKRGEWTSTAKDGTVNVLKEDPFEQATSNAHSLIRYLRSIPRWPSRWGPIGHAVCFPDGLLGSRPLPHMQDALIDASHLATCEALAGRFEELFGFWFDNRSRAGIEGFHILVDTLAHDVQIRHPLRLDLDEADREILKLSAQQLRVLDMLAGNRRVAVHGPAGSGKTILAIEKAKRLAGQGIRVLFTCFNRPLAEHVSRALANESRVAVFTFHQLAMALAQEATIPLRGDRSSQTFWDETLPAAFEKAVEILGPRYDALVVDEAQDFDASWWTALQLLLRDPDEGICYVFYDDNQAIYREPAGLPDGMVDVALTENWRNTVAINDAVAGFYEGGTIACRSPQGPDIQMTSIAEEDLRAELSKVLHQIVLEGEVNARDVVVLTPHATEHSSLRGRVGAFTLTEDPVGKQDIRLTSIYRFKGLEAKAVIVCDVNRYVDEDFVKLMYVACSRARTLLWILLTESKETALDR